jgi:hypothetical protein
MSGFTLAELATYEQTAVKPVDPSPPAASQPGTPAPAESSPAEGVASDATVDSSADPTPAPAGEAAPAEVEPAGEPEPKSKGARERIEDLVAERNALKKYAEYLQTQMQAPKPEAQAPVEQPAAAVTTDDAPTLESVGFDTDKWTKAMHAWTAKQIEQGVTKAVTNVQAKQEQATARQAFETRMTALAAKTPDLQLVLGNPALPRLDTEAAKLVVASELGPQILYHLGKNPDKAARIARQNTAGQAAAIGRIEAELSAAATTPAKKPTNNITKAPAPPTPTPAGGAARTDPMTMSMAEFVKHERAQALEKRIARNRR